MSKPDPAAYGWKPTGVNEQSRVAFYERDGVKMDYYYTTGELEAVGRSARCAPWGSAWTACTNPF